MSEVTLKDPIRAIHGKLSKRDDVYWTERFGKQYAVRMKPYVDKPTVNQLEARERMRVCNEMVQALLRSEEASSRYQASWLAARACGADKHSRLRDYLYQLCYQKLYKL